MISFLTSSFVSYQREENYIPEPADSSYFFVDNLKKYWKEDCHFLHFTSDPDDYAMTDFAVKDISEALALSGLSIGESRAFDGRGVENYAKAHNMTKDEAYAPAFREALAWADVLFLAGGHAPTENAFLEKCHVREALGADDKNRDNLENYTDYENSDLNGEKHGTNAGNCGKRQRRYFDGIVLALSAGSMNAAESVYLIPELAGEAADPDFKTEGHGLGLTQIRMVPHIRYTENVVLDGKAMMDILKEASFRYPLYLVPDGSYFLIKDGVPELFGPAQVMEKGKVRPLEQGIIISERMEYHSMHDFEREAIANTLGTFFRGSYDWIAMVDAATQKLDFIYVSSYYQSQDFYPLRFDNFAEMMADFKNRFVVADERGSVDEQLNIPFIGDIIRRDREFVRTIHIDSEAGVQAQKFTMRPLGDYTGDTGHLLMTMVNINSVVNHDVMTDEYSRSGFMEEAALLLKNAPEDAEYSLCYINIPGFKAANDLFSIHAGDMIIFCIAYKLHEEFNPLLVGRLEADHFVILTENANLTDEKLQKLGDMFYQEGTKQYHYSIHIGIYPISDRNQSITHMIDRAKLVEKSISPKQGKNYAVYDEEMRIRYMEQRTFEASLERAVSQNEIIPYYQPIVDAKTGEIVSAEALVRWNHPELGMIPPGRFVPLFEQNGQITRIDYHMVDSVLEFNLERRKKGLRIVPCAVNLSRVDFYDSGLISSLVNSLKASDEMREVLKLEVTESAYQELEDSAIEFLSYVKKLGMSILLDDFGSGMSSLSALESLEFDTIKLDIGFIRKIGKNKKTEAIIKSSIEMAHGLGATVVAEGVETEEQHVFLRDAGCDYIQGFYFYKPLPESEFAALLDKNT